jgi:malate:Na+ symporter
MSTILESPPTTSTRTSDPDLRTGVAHEVGPRALPADAGPAGARTAPGVGVLLTWVLPAAITAFVLVAGQLNAIPRNMIGGLAVITGLGMLLGPLGNKIPVISKIGGGALLCLMVPSIAVAAGLFNKNTLDAATSLMKEANFLYFVISVLVVGSIVGMHRGTMLRGIVKVFPPLIVGTAASIAVGIGVAMLFGYSFSHALFYIVVPIISGGIGEGVIPLSAAYSSALGGTADSYVAKLIPATVIGNIVAIITAGLLRRLGDARPHLDGSGELVKVSADKSEPAPVRRAVGTPNPALGVLVITGLYTLGSLLEPLVHLPAPILVIIFSVLLKLSNVVPVGVEDSVRAIYKVFSGYFIYPLMVGLGLLYIPLSGMLDVLSVGFVLACVAVVLCMAASGFFVGKLLNMYPVDASLVTVCHSGLGGTGDVAILSASQRMVLMPFAQISTRVGGVTTVIAAASLIRLIG